MVKVDVRFINLDRATERRRLLEASFGQSRFSDRWSIDRFAALSATSDLVRSRPGRMSGSYKGNFLSHYECVRQSVGSSSHLLVAEDDTMFCTETGPILEDVIDRMPENSWDVLMPEITFLSASSYPIFYKLCTCKDLAGKVRLLDLGEFPHPYVGSNAYVVNRNAKEKFLQVLAPYAETIEHPFDICLRAALHYRNLRGLLIFPFLTAPSVEADESQAPIGPMTAAQEASKWVHTQLVNALRRLVWLGYRPDAVMAEDFASRAHHLLRNDRDEWFQKVMPWMLFLQINTSYRDYEPLKFLPVDFLRLGSIQTAGTSGAPTAPVAALEDRPSELPPRVDPA